MLFKMVLQDRCVDTRALLHEDHYRAYRKIVQTILRWLRKWSCLSGARFLDQTRSGLGWSNAGNAGARRTVLSLALRCFRKLAIGPPQTHGTPSNIALLPLAVSFPFLQSVSSFTVSLLGFTPDPRVAISRPISVPCPVNATRSPRRQWVRRIFSSSICKSRFSCPGGLRDHASRSASQPPWLTRRTPAS